METVHIALIGAPSTGKTTVAKALEKKGYHVLSEVARELITQQKESGGEILPWIDREKFQEEVSKTQIKRRESSKDKNLVIADTSIACGIAYHLVEGFPASEKLWERAKKYPYDKVFLLEFLPFYEDDGLRTEDKIKSEKIQKHLVEIHEKLGHEIISVPFMSVENRVKFIEKHLKN